MTASSVAEISTYELGYRLNRTALNNLEAGLRKSVAVAEIQAIATAIGAAPLSLIISTSECQESVVENKQVDGWTAWKWFTGEEQLEIVEGQDNALSKATGNFVRWKRALEESVEAFNTAREANDQKTAQEEALVAFISKQRLNDAGHEAELPEPVYAAGKAALDRLTRSSTRKQVLNELEADSAGSEEQNNG